MNSDKKRKGLGAEEAAERDPTALAHAVDLIFGTCCLAGAPSVIADFIDEDKFNAIGEHDTAALFNMLVIAFSHQGTSDLVAHDYMQRHGTPTWRGIQSEFRRGAEPSCDKLASYWQFSQCRYDKTSRTCSEPDHLDNCPLPTHRLRNGRLNQMAYSLFLFMRDIAAGDFVGWINEQLATVPTPDHSTLDRQEALIGPLQKRVQRVGQGSDDGLVWAFDRRFEALSGLARGWRWDGGSRHPGSQLPSPDRNSRSVRCGPSVWTEVLPSRLLRRYFASCVPPDRRSPIRPEFSGGISALCSACGMAVLLAKWPRHL